MLRRGDVVTVSAGSGFGSKPRPALLIQSDQLDDLTTAVVLMFTTELDQAKPIRIIVLPDDTNGLRETSDLMVDVPVTVRREKIGGIIGRLSATDLARAETQLLLILGFA